jgi:hypothetical protein
VGGAIEFCIGIVGAAAPHERHVFFLFFVQQVRRTVSEGAAFVLVLPLITAVTIELWRVVRLAGSSDGPAVMVGSRGSERIYWLCTSVAAAN